MKTKLVLLSLLVLLVYCTEAEVKTPTPVVQPVSCEYYFNSWELGKEDGAYGMFFLLPPDDDYLIFATNEESGLHEVGHLADRENGYPSQTEAFQNAVYEYLFNTDIPENELELHHYLFVMYEWGNYDDCFAQLYMWNILYELPKEFTDFFK